MKQFRDTPYYVTEHGKIYRNEKELSFETLKSGYLIVTFCINKKRKKFLIHRLVAETYIPNPENKPEVNHIDGNKLNNDVSNLEWVTKKENIEHAVENLLFSHVLTEKEVLWIRENYIPKHKEFGGASLSRKFGVHQTTIHYLVNNKTWKHL